MNHDLPYYNPLKTEVPSQVLPRDAEGILEYLIKLFPLRLPTRDEIRNDPQITHVLIGEQNVIMVCRNILEKLRK